MPSVPFELLTTVINRIPAFTEIHLQRGRKLLNINQRRLPKLNKLELVTLYQSNTAKRSIIQTPSQYKMDKRNPEMIFKQTKYTV